MQVGTPSPRNDVVYLFRSGFWLNSSSVVTLLLSFGISIAYANFLPKEVYGTYQYLLALFSILSAFTLTGMNSAITRSVARGHEGVLRTSLPYQLRWNLVSSAIALGCAGYYFLNSNQTLSLGSLCIAVALPLISAFNSYTAFLMGKKEFRTLFIYTTAASLIYYALILIGILYFPSALTLIFINLGITVITTIAAYLYTVHVFKPKIATDPDVQKYGTHLTVMNTFSTVAGQLDTILVFHFLGPAQLAIYSFATLIPEKLSGLLKNLTNSALPRFAEQRFSTLRTSIWPVVSFLFALILGGVIAYALLVPWLFTQVYPQYVDAIPYTQIFILTLFAGIGNYIGTPLMAHRRIRRLYAINTISPILQLVLQVIGILVWGLWGLVWARVIWTALFLVLVTILAMFEPKSAA